MIEARLQTSPDHATEIVSEPDNGATGNVIFGVATEALIEARRAQEARWGWSAWMLAHTREVYCSILSGRKVQARQLDATALRRALRGEPLPSPYAYIEITAEMLDAI